MPANAFLTSSVFPHMFVLLNMQNVLVRNTHHQATNTANDNNAAIPAPLNNIVPPSGHPNNFKIATIFCPICPDIRSTDNKIFVISWDCGNPKKRLAAIPANVATIAPTVMRNGNCKQSFIRNKFSFFNIKQTSKRKIGKTQHPSANIPVEIPPMNNPTKTMKYSAALPRGSLSSL